MTNPYPTYYIVSWESKLTGKTGKSTEGMDFIEAQRIAKRLNKTYPYIHHMVYLKQILEQVHRITLMRIKLVKTLNQ